MPVSYTHLDVYKRQAVNDAITRKTNHKHELMVVTIPGPEPVYICDQTESMNRWQPAKNFYIIYELYADRKRNQNRVIISELARAPLCVCDISVPATSWNIKINFTTDIVWNRIIIVMSPLLAWYLLVFLVLHVQIKYRLYENKGNNTNIIFCVLFNVSNRPGRT